MLEANTPSKESDCTNAPKIDIFAFHILCSEYCMVGSHLVLLAATLFVLAVDPIPMLATISAKDKNKGKEVVAEPRQR